MVQKKMCVLEERECIGCGECDRCDLDPEKICDNCMKCVRTDAEYRAIVVDDFALDGEVENHEQHHHDCKCGCDHHHH